MGKALSRLLLFDLVEPGEETRGVGAQGGKPRLAVGLESTDMVC